MTRKTCPDCHGTGRESCSVHGSHRCSRCCGSGCIKESGIYVPGPKFTCWAEAMRNAGRGYPI